MSVPVTIALIIADIIFAEGSVFSELNLIIILISTLICFITGYFSMHLLLKIAQKIQFGYFCISYGIIAVIIILPFFFIN